MKLRVALTSGIVVAAVLAALSCRRSDVRSLTIDVPEMADARDVRIVTNAALNEVVGQYDGIQNSFEIDLLRKLVVYHESQRLVTPEYQRQIEARLREVGLNGRVLEVRLNPPLLVPTENGAVQMWPNRYTAVISVPDMTSQRAANIAVDAIAYARVGGDHPRVAVDRPSRRIVATYESLALSRRNIEYAIACVGYAANDTPANLGVADALPHGWSPVTL